MGFSLCCDKSLLKVCELLLVATHGLEVFGLVGVVGGLHFLERDLFRRIVCGSDLACPFECKVLEHVG